MTAPQIIRSVEELKALDPDTQLMTTDLHWESAIMPQRDWLDDWEIDPHGIFPLAVIAPGPQVRAARQALKEATE